MHRVDGVFLRLQPVAGYLGEHDLHEAVRPVERLPIRQFRGRQRAHVGPEHPGQCAHPAGLQAGLGAQPAGRVHRVFIGLRDAPAIGRELPAVVVAADALIFDITVGQVGPAVRALALHQAVAAGAVTEQDPVLAQQAHGLDGRTRQRIDGRHRVPVAPHHLAHRRARADLGQLAVLLGAQHRAPAVQSGLKPEALMMGSQWASSSRCSAAIARPSRKCG